MAKQLIVVLGPTAVGKTALAIQLAQHFSTEIISADSRQIFEELNIGVARPSVDELNAVHHHFIAHTSIHAEYSAGAFEREATQLLNTLFESKDQVICCGGSTLYLTALIQGLDDLPGDPEIKSYWIERFENEGLLPLQAELQKLDPEYYEQVDRENAHRLIRALEVCQVSGTTYTSLRKGKSKQREFNCVKIGLTGERLWLYDRINQRVDAMIESGLEKEAFSVFPFKSLTSLQTVGYNEWFDFFEGKWSREEAINKIKQHTRNYAKRQLTYWKRDDSIHWIQVDQSKDILLEALSFIPVSPVK